MQRCEDKTYNLGDGTRKWKVYADEAVASKFTLHDNASTPTKKAYLQWNGTDQSIDFIFN